MGWRAIMEQPANLLETLPMELLLMISKESDPPTREMLAKLIETMTAGKTWVWEVGKLSVKYDNIRSDLGKLSVLEEHVVDVEVVLGDFDVPEENVAVRRSTVVSQLVSLKDKELSRSFTYEWCARCNVQYASHYCCHYMSSTGKIEGVYDRDDDYEWSYYPRICYRDSCQSWLIKFLDLTITEPMLLNHAIHTDEVDYLDGCVDEGWIRDLMIIKENDDCMAWLKYRLVHEDDCMKWLIDRLTH